MSTATEKNETAVSQRLADASSSEDDLITQLQREKLAKKKSHKKKAKLEVNTLDKYQMELSLLILSAIFVFDKFEATRPFVYKFIHLQNRYPGTNYYDIDIKNDGYFIVTGILVSTFIRAFTMNYVLRPFAYSMNIKSHKAVQRFMEQGWYLVYYSISLGFGSYLCYNSSYFMNADNFYIGWPHDQMTWLFKAYYLTELAGWLQQIFTLNIEQRRKDHWQMFSHHIITCFLVGGSYYYYFTRIGNVIMSIMDVVDILLSTAKLLKYCGVQYICDLMFGLFVVTWVVLRHGLYNYILYHTATRCKMLIANAKCVPGVYQKRCWDDHVIDIFVLLLAMLQVLMFVWMYLIIKVVVKVLTGKGAEDVRSDADTDEE